MLRRRGPAYLRSWTLRDLHAVAGKFQRDRASWELSEHQEWLYDRILEELVWRRRHAQRHHIPHGCSCWMCCSDISPF